MRNRYAEDGHDRIADELVDNPAVRLDDALHPHEEVREQRTGCFRVDRLSRRRRADDVAEKHRYDLALDPFSG
ncbi:MAG TPA: hypothetical protein VH416_08880 [Gaiellaceae bacterium]